MSSKLHKKLERDIRFLEQNEVPMETSGVRIEKLDYDGDSSDEEKRLNDDDVRNLADALMKNDVFQGPLDLSKNNLTDLVSYRSLFCLLLYLPVLTLYFFVITVLPLPEGGARQGGCCQHHQARPRQEQGPQEQGRHPHWRRTPRQPRAPN